MIKPGEIQKKAGASGVRDQQIEKDYVLSWILCGVAQHRQLSEAKNSTYPRQRSAERKSFVGIDA